MAPLFVFIIIICCTIAWRLLGPKLFSGGTDDSNDPAHDARETARSMFDTEIEFSRYEEFTPAEFDALEVSNHRARLYSSPGVRATLEDIFPESDRPRGAADLSSVIWAQTQHGLNISLLEEDGHLTVLDGVHRIVAAYLANKTICADIYVRSEELAVA